MVTKIENETRAEIAEFQKSATEDFNKTQEVLRKEYEIESQNLAQEHERRLTNEKELLKDEFQIKLNADMLAYRKRIEEERRPTPQKIEASSFKILQNALEKSSAMQVNREKISQSYRVDFENRLYQQKDDLERYFIDEKERLIQRHREMLKTKNFERRDNVDLNIMKEEYFQKLRSDKELLKIQILGEKESVSCSCKVNQINLQKENRLKLEKMATEKEAQIEEEVTHFKNKLECELKPCQ